MKNFLLVLLTVFLVSNIHGQIVERMEINGRIIVDVNDVEGVTVFNTSSNKGTITNKNGEFEMMVALNDIIEFSALQFEKFKIKIDEKIIRNKYVTVYLVERINKLDEVVITPYDMLSGNLITDVESVETFNADLDAIYFGVNDIYAFEFTDDYKSGVENIILREGQYYDGFNIKNALGLILKPIFKNKENENSAEENIPKVAEVTKDITDVYGQQFLINTFNIPEDKVEAFVAFVNSSGFDQALLSEKNEIKLIEHLYHKSQMFLKPNND